MTAYVTRAQEFDKRVQEFGITPKNLIEPIVISHIKAGKGQKHLFLDVRSDAERKVTLLRTNIPVAHLIVTPTDTSALEESTLKAYFPNKQGKERKHNQIFVLFLFNILLHQFIYPCFFYKDTIVVFCGSGGQAGGAAKEKLQTLGYQNVYNAGGYDDMAHLQVSELNCSGCLFRNKYVLADTGI
jgi:rhodanese-related sulfurtransferase